jgi:5-hydroxyisourate hydrolase
MARLSTHVLDTSRGKPAHNLIVDLHFCWDGERRYIKSAVTNADGRTSEPLLSGDLLETGVYELTFHAGDYFRSTGVELPNPPFLADVVIRFGLADPAGNYHVPLLLSPYGYSTYRGS